jgi:enamine deaminase RidA (YjgF/YER057c/UK114 family)
MGPQAALHIDYAPLDDVRLRPQGWWQDILGAICFGGSPEPLSPAPEDVPLARVGAQVLAAGHGIVELWRVRGPTQSGWHRRVQYRRHGQLLFACLQVAEQDFQPGAGDLQGDTLWHATAAAYRELFEALAALGHAHPVRIWNFMPHINGATADGERYFHFNDARRSAFVGARRSIAGNVPAASALGLPCSSPLTVYCIAAARAPIALENPRQRSAWDYPRQYGPTSPTFARACIESGSGDTLFISGTASIVGHVTAHPGDARAQTLETLRNIRAVLAAANARVAAARYAMDRLRYKVYVRRAEDLPTIDSELRGQIGHHAPVLYVQADICRGDLLLEIEAVGF